MEPINSCNNAAVDSGGGGGSGEQSSSSLTSSTNITSIVQKLMNNNNNQNNIMSGREGEDIPSSLPSVKLLGKVYQTQSNNHIKSQQILVGKSFQKKTTTNDTTTTNGESTSTSTSPFKLRGSGDTNIINNNNGSNVVSDDTTITTTTTTTTKSTSTTTNIVPPLNLNIGSSSPPTETTTTNEEQKGENQSPSSSFASTSSSSSSSSSSSETKGWKTQHSVPLSPPTVSRKIRNSYRSSKLIDSNSGDDGESNNSVNSVGGGGGIPYYNRSISPTTTHYMNEFPPLAPVPARNTNGQHGQHQQHQQQQQQQQQQHKDIIDHPISQSYSGPSSSSTNSSGGGGVGGAFKNFNRNHQAHRVAGDWRDKVFTQGVTANLDRKERRNLLIGSREPSLLMSNDVDETGGLTITTSTMDEEEKEVQSLVDKFRVRKGSNSRKSKLTSKDVEWITKKFVDQQEDNNNNPKEQEMEKEKETNNNNNVKIKQQQESTTTTTTTTTSTITITPEVLDIKQSLNNGKNNMNNGNINSIGRRKRGKTVANQYVRAPKLSSSSPSSIDSSGEEDDDDDEIITPMSMPSYRFLEEAGKRRYLVAEPSRKPGIKPPLFLHVPTVAHPIQFHQSAPEKINSSTMSVAVEENVNTPTSQSHPTSTSLLYNHQIINRVAHDKDLSYQFFPALSISHKAPHRHHHHMTILQTTPNINNNNNNKTGGGVNTGGVVGQAKQPAKNNALGLGIKGSPTSTSTSPSSPSGLDDPSYLSMSLSPPSSSTAPITESVLSASYTPRTNEAQRKSYWPIRFGQQPTPVVTSKPSATQPMVKDGDNNNNNNQQQQEKHLLATSPDSATTTASPASSLGSSPSITTGISPVSDSNHQSSSSTSPPTAQQQTTNSNSTILRSDSPINVDNLYRGIEEDFKDRSDIYFVNNNNLIGNNANGSPNVFALSIHSKRAIKIKCGTVDALVEALTHHQLSDPNFAETFLLTFKTFTTADYFLSRLTYRYEQASHIVDDRDPSMSDEQHQSHLEKQTIIARTVKLRVCSIIKMWIDKHFHDFDKSPKLLDELENFVTGPLCEDGMEKIAQNIQRTIQRRLAGEQKDIIIHGRIPPAIIPNLKNEQIPTLFVFDDLEIARQLTLIEHESYSLIKPYECVNLAFSKPGKEEKAPNIWNIIKRSNNIPLWVATEIVQEERLTKRANIIKKFISIADHCRNLNNYNAVMEILSGLNMTPVYRLKKTWETISRKYLATFKHLNSLMANKGNFKVYRDVLHTKNPPCLPFLGVYLTDLTFLEEGSPETLEGGLINMIKRTQLAAVIQEIQQFQQQPYSFTPVPIIRDFLLQVQGLQERALYKQSKLIEP
ncbi:RasGEF domain-containing protein [Cavenderia fasciculata]|uniref:RasGEF domain-containing protein n=1 Tax=Cavenderia fasciculata TaxID=261658 RepID=F4Q1P0_CACFS|nr:RasGEF domain-containing protein [Cavenderia fasciculata]EGG18190.1 RasGEF domain-containing protein [Cavenderia fasciculata]|eukprot:XP_004357013.1 RasGEF domain-containing protein [Cavenderia fasciculata]